MGIRRLMLADIIIIMVVMIQADGRWLDSMILCEIPSKGARRRAFVMVDNENENDNADDGDNHHP